MAFPQSSRAYADMEKPEAWGICDRCGFRYLRKDLVWQFDFRGLNLANLRILVCTATCNDEPQPQLKPILVGPDPVPVKDPRPGFAATQEGYTPAVNVLELLDGDLLPPSPSLNGSGLYNDGGVLMVLPSASLSWPTADPGIPGALWSNGFVVTASLPTSPPASPPPVYLSQTTSLLLLALGANIMPITSPPAGSGQLWVNAAMGGEVWVA